MKNLKAVSVDHLSGPIGGYGFRRGEWTLTLEDGTIDKIYCSIPHNLTLNEQSDLILSQYNK